MKGSFFALFSGLDDVLILSYELLLEVEITLEGRLTLVERTLGFDIS